MGDIVQPVVAARVEIASRLIDVEAELRRLQLWQSEAPSAQALASTEPFAMDTLEFHQWLQFIFLPTLYGIIDADRPLPEQCAIAPMAEQAFRQSELGVKRLLELLRELDTLISENP